ncbi:MAG TPA: pyridoxal-phosphate dependent enzyme [Gaiellaceae bacterium]|nr:pyridoxal-phosphate dependent enzyme [Gaiellaceae bacterium]
MISPDDVRAAARLLDGIAHRTPPITSRSLGEHVVIKPECLQRAGAFKFRGAYNKIASLPTGTPVLAYSSGNHAQAVALAARLLGSQATILMPHDAPQSKLDATRGYGAEVVSYDRYSDDREAVGEQLAAERGLELVRPYDDPLVMAGAGTAALELLEDAGIVDTLVTPVGGGGLISGSATIARELGVSRVVGVEPAAGDDWRQSLASGERVRIDVPRTIADGLQTNQPGRLTWEVGSRLVDEIVTVTDEQIVEAMRFAFERLKLVIEPSGAVGIAAVREGLVSGGRIGVIVSGGNVDTTRFAELLAR